MKITPRPITRKTAEQIIAFLPYFQKKDLVNAAAQPCELSLYDVYEKESSQILNEFLELCSSSFIAVYLDSRGDWGMLDRRDELIQNPELIPSIDLLTLRMLFGNLKSAGQIGNTYIDCILNGDIIVVMLLRLKALIPDIPTVTKENEQWLDKIIAWADEKGIEDYNTTPKTQDIVWGGLPRDKELLLNSYTLQLGWNDIGELPKEIGNLTNLIELRLWCSKLTKLPKEIGNLLNLKELSLEDNNLSCLPEEIGNLINLEILDLTTNSIKELPKEIGNLLNLRELNLAENNLTCLPKEIGNLINLEELDLYDNPIKELPVEINNFSKLRVLGLYETDIPLSILKTIQDNNKSRGEK